MTPEEPDIVEEHIELVTTGPIAVPVDVSWSGTETRTEEGRKAR